MLKAFYGAHFIFVPFKGTIKIGLIVLLDFQNKIFILYTIYFVKFMSIGDTIC